MHLLRRLLGPILFLLASQASVLFADTSITLSPVTAPAAGEPGVTLINVTGSGFPSGTITPSLVAVSLQPASVGSSPQLNGVVTAVTTIVGSTRRVTFQIPTGISIATPTNYLVSVSGTTSSGANFSSGNTAALVVNPPAAISLNPGAGLLGQSLTVTIAGNFSNFFQGSTQANFG